MCGYEVVDAKHLTVRIRIGRCQEDKWKFLFRVETSKPLRIFV